MTLNLGGNAVIVVGRVGSARNNNVVSMRVVRMVVIFIALGLDLAT